jgi:hypothetical protein
MRKQQARGGARIRMQGRDSGFHAQPPPEVRQSLNFL